MVNLFRKHHISILATVLLWLASNAVHAQTAGDDPLPSWNDTGTKSAIISFVNSVTEEGSSTFVPPGERIATIDNDGTLWSEQPLYFQGFFALDRIREISENHPEWKTTEPFKSAVEGNMDRLMSAGEEGIMKVLMAAHSDISTRDYAAVVKEWLANTKHPQTGMLFTDMVFQPMLELLDYLRANDFTIFIVSGGGMDFVRAFSEEVYGVPTERVIGTTLDAKFEMRDGIPLIVKEPTIMLIDDKAGKPVGIYRHIGRRPIFAAGNSDGDLQMLQYTTIPRNNSDKTPRFGLIVHHTDAEREFAYDRQSLMGKLDIALDQAEQQGWTVVDMKEDWNTIYPESNQ